MEAQLSTQHSVHRDAAKLTEHHHSTPKSSLSPYTRTKISKHIGMFPCTRKTVKYIRTCYCNRIDNRIINHKDKKITTLEMSCPWTQNHGKKGAENTRKCGPLRNEFKQQFKGYNLEQFNIIMDVLGGYSIDREEKMKAYSGTLSRR